MTDCPIPFNRVATAGRELEYLAAAAAQGHLSGDGPFTRRCHAMLEALLGAPRVLLTTSCTHALELAALLLEVGPGDEVVLPAFTFFSTANAFVLRGAVPRFADVRPDTLNLDEETLPALLSPHTRAVVVVHYAGVGCAMEPIAAAAERAGAALVEDNAHGLFGAWCGRPLGSFGALATLSFHETKNVTCGEGGALVVNDPRFAQRAEILREKGTDRSRFFRGEVDRYGWVDVGSSYLPSELNAAFLLAQLERHGEIQARRREIWERYDRELAGWADRHGVRRPVVPPECSQPYHLYYLLLPTGHQRDALIQHLRRQGILAVFHYLPLHLSPMGRRLGGRPGDCPVTEEVSERLVRLPLFPALNPGEQEQVIAAVLGFTP